MGRAASLRVEGEGIVPQERRGAGLVTQPKTACEKYRFAGHVAGGEG